MRLSAAISALLVVIFLIVPMSASGPKQSSPPAGSQPDSQFGQQDRRDERAIPPDLERKMAKERARVRYESIKRDSEKLLELATELKQYVDKSSESVLSMDVIKKCDEIEKLSKSVRNKMKGE
jgi:hypothetical protein